MARFKARARTIDMLGRQQIAGIPTALSELFKNAHDAYATRVEVDYFRTTNLLVIRDDGYGMTKADFEGKWLTVGTESKFQKSNDALNLFEKNENDVRPIMGEKGIGRLAIASIGPQVFVITRAVRKNTLSPIVISFINWQLFELPGVNLDQIDVPVVEVNSLSEIDETVISDLIDQSSENLKTLTGISEPDSIAKIVSNLNFLKQNFHIEKYFGNNKTFFSGKDHGTQFFIMPVDSSLADDIGDDTDPSDVSNLQKMLLGFSNTMQEENEVPLRTEFRDHLKDGSIIPRIGSGEFFQPEDFQLADHKLSGDFDEYGNFRGKISIYQKEARDVEILTNTSGKKLECGSFFIDFAYLQGNKKQSLAPAIDYDRFSAKLNRIGGLYMYRDGIRILPYGNSDYDFLEIERRRTLSAKFYFFSYRRMWGAIKLTKSENHNLEEKAGREGFMNNRAYQQFRRTLMDFFVKLAELYFREDGVYSDEWDALRHSIQKENEVAERRKKAVSAKKKDWQAKMDDFFNAIENDEIGKFFSKTEPDLLKKLDAILKNDSLDKVASDILLLQSRVEFSVRKEFERYKISRPRGVGFTKKLEKDWRAYEQHFEDSVQHLFADGQRRIEKILGDIVEKSKIHLDNRSRMEASIFSLRDFNSKKISDEQNDTKKVLGTVYSHVKDQIRSSRQKFEELKNSIDRKINEANFEDMPSDAFYEFKIALEKELEDVSSDLKIQLENTKAHLLRVPEGTENDISSDASIAALETELEMLRDDYSINLEMAQLGMAVSVIHHEFEANVKGIRHSLKILQRFAEKNESLKPLYTNIRTGFDHLDNYLGLFTPLDKRLRRSKTKLSGEAISDFVNDLFSERFVRHEVSFIVSPEFLKFSMSGYASVIFPVVINLIDNAIYWLSRKNGQRIVKLDVSSGGGFSIIDNGPGISPRDLPFIFDFGYSKKIGGRGMGLYIAQQSLKKEGYSILVSDDNGFGTKFIVEPEGETNA